MGRSKITLDIEAFIKDFNALILIVKRRFNDFQAFVTSVNGKQGDIILTTDDIVEGTNNLYFNNSSIESNSEVSANTSSRHTHTNKLVLDQIEEPFTTSLESDLILNTSARHGHPNKAVLDLIEEPFLTSHKGKLDDIEALAKDDQIASEVPVSTFGSSVTNNVQESLENLDGAIVSSETTKGGLNDLVVGLTNSTNCIVSGVNAVIDASGCTVSEGFILLEGVYLKVASQTVLATGGNPINNWVFTPDLINDGFGIPEHVFTVTPGALLVDGNSINYELTQTLSVVNTTEKGLMTSDDFNYLEDLSNGALPDISGLASPITSQNAFPLQALAYGRVGIDNLGGTSTISTVQGFNILSVVKATSNATLDSFSINFEKDLGTSNYILLFSHEIPGSSAIYDIHAYANSGGTSTYAGFSFYKGSAPSFGVLVYASFIVLKV